MHNLRYLMHILRHLMHILRHLMRLAVFLRHRRETFMQGLGHVMQNLRHLMPHLCYLMHNLRCLMQCQCCLRHCQYCLQQSPSLPYAASPSPSALTSVSLCTAFLNLTLACQGYKTFINYLFFCGYASTTTTNFRLFGFHCRLHSICSRKERS